VFRLLCGSLLGAAAIALALSPLQAAPSPMEVAPHPRVGASIRVGSFPNGVAVGYGFVWVTTFHPVGLGMNQSGVVKVDPTTNRVVDSFAVRDASDVAVGAGSVWVVSDNGRDGVIKRIDPNTDRVMATIPVGRWPSNIDFGLDAVYVTLNLPSANEHPVGEVIRIDPATNQVVARIRVDGGWPRDIAIGEAAVWVYGHSKHSGNVWSTSSLWEIDPQADLLVGTVLDRKGFLSDGINFPDGVSVGDGYVWVANAWGNGLRIDPVTHSKKRFSVMGGFPAPFAVYAGGVWHLGNHGLSRLDTTTLREKSFGLRSLSIIAAALDEASGTLWVASYTNTITRIELTAGT
jgi:hypothetical protein